MQRTKKTGSGQGRRWWRAPPPLPAHRASRRAPPNPQAPPCLPLRPRRRLAMEQKEKGEGAPWLERRKGMERERRKGKGMEGGAPLEKDGGGVTWCVGHMGSTVTFRWERSPGNSSCRLQSGVLFTWHLEFDIIAVLRPRCA